jgi:hypothetical protein
MSGTKRTPEVEEKVSKDLLFPEDDHAATLELLAKQALAVELGVAALPAGSTTHSTQSVAQYTHRTSSR